jgi:cell division septation protein DedD
MNHLLDHELDHDIHRDESSGDREISLGAGTILAMFFGLALLCGAVFGVGYSIGRRSAQNVSPPVIIGNGSAPALNSVLKPAAGYTAPAPTEAEQTDTVPETAAPSSKISPADGLIAGDKIPQTAPAASAAVPAISSSGSFMVQVAAVSTQDIANIELAALKKFNYPVVVRHEPTDQLLHLQIGPFATKKEAEAMRQDVLSHGFNAIVKQ